MGWGCDFSSRKCRVLCIFIAKNYLTLSDVNKDLSHKDQDKDKD